MIIDDINVQRLPAAGFRVGTGPVKIGNDWTGVFIRGDEAAGISVVLKAIAENQTKDAFRKYLMHITVLLDLAHEHKTC